MNVTLRKSLMVALATTMGVMPGVQAAPLNDLSSASGTAGVRKTTYMPIESKETSTEYYNAYASYASTTTYAAVVTGTTTMKDGGDLDAYIYTMPGYPVSAAKTLVVKVSLTGGAKFLKAPFLYCSHSAQGPSNPGSMASISAAVWSNSVLATDVTAQPGGALSVTAYKLIPTNQTTKQASYTFIFPEGFVVSEKNSGACILTYTADVGSVAQGTTPVPGTAVSVIQGGAVGQNIELKSEVTYNDFFNSASVTATVPLVTFVTAYKAEFSKNGIGAAPNNAVGYAQIDVVKSSKQFVKDSVNSTKAFVGSFIVTAVDSTKKIRTTTGSVVNASALISTATVTINGTTVGNIGKIGLDLGGPATCDGTYTLTAAPAATTTTTTTTGTATTTSTSVGSVTFTIEKPTSYAATDAFNVVSSTMAADAHTAMYVCLEADGTKVMSDGALTVTFNATSPSGSSYELGSGDLTTVTRNGAAVRVLNVPSTTNADQAFIRFYNTSAQETKVTGTLYGQDGKVIGKEGGELFSSLKPYDVKAISAAQLATKLETGATPWSGRAWLLIQAPIAPEYFKVQSLVRAPNGTLVNVSTDAAD